MEHQDVIIEPSKWDGRHITYVDRFKLVHTGNVIGQEPGGKILFIQSDKRKVDKATWHFTIDSRIIKAVLDKPPTE